MRLREREYRQLVKLQKKLARRGLKTDKSQLVRAGLLLLSRIDRHTLKTAIRDVIAPEPGLDNRA